MPPTLFGAAWTLLFYSSVSVRFCVALFILVVVVVVVVVVLLLLLLLLPPLLKVLCTTSSAYSGTVTCLTVSFWRVFFSYSHIQSAQKPLPINTLGTFDHTCLQMPMGLKAYTFKAHKASGGKMGQKCKKCRLGEVFGQIVYRNTQISKHFLGTEPGGKSR